MLGSVRLYRFHFKAIPVVVTLVVVAVCARLGFWQLSRGVDKEQRLAQIAHYQKQGELSFDNLLSLKQQHDPTGVMIKFSGSFLNPQSWLLDNRIVNGKPGYDVLLAIKPAGFSKYVVVNMGWIKGDYGNRDVLPSFDIPADNVQLTAYVKAKDIESFVLSEQSNNNQQWPYRVQQVNIEAIAGQTDLPFYDFMLYAKGQQDFGFTQHYEPVVMAPEKHRGYALQWFLLAVAALAVFLFASKDNDLRGEKP